MRFVLCCALILGFAVPWASADTIEENLSRYTDETAAGYLAPLSNGFGQNLNTAYYTTARIPKEGFYLRFQLHLMNVKFDDEDRTFTATADPDFPNQDPTEVPTVVGDEESVTIMGNGAKFTFPPGLDMSGMPLAVPQLTIGSVSGTEAIIRWFGLDTDSEDINKVELFGVGLRHNVSQYFEDFPVDLAASVMYQTFTVDDDLIDGSALAFGVQGSKLVPVSGFMDWEPFASITLDQWENTTKFTVNEGEEDEEERTLDFDTESSVHLTLGSGLNFDFMRLFGAVNVAERFGWNVGISFGN